MGNNSDSINMKRKIVFKVIFVLFAILTTFIFIQLITGDGDIHGQELVSLEDSIIIRDIKMESEEPMRDIVPHAPEGNIIYDDSFDDAIIDYDKENKKNIESKKETNSVTPKSIHTLKAKDRRWHLVKYRIRRNDNLWTIARRHGINHKLIIEINNITNPDKLLPGKYIDIPSKNGVFHTIRRGDTISGIAHKYRVKISSIKSHNRIRGTTIIKGKRIFIPGARKQVARSRKNNRSRKIARTKKRYGRRRNLQIAWPVRGKITSGFGRRRDPFSGKRKFHCGIDISANIGRPIRAALKGRVIFSGWKGGYGKVVVMRHNKGYITVYAHNSKNIVKVNDVIPKGRTIAYTGNTGAVTGAHLHFELRKYLTPLNPLRFLNR